jgi:hypothetical protein
MRGYTRGVAATFPNGRAKQRHGFVYSTAGGLGALSGGMLRIARLLQDITLCDVATVRYRGILAATSTTENN